MRHRQRLTARLAALPLEARQEALAHMALLIRQRRTQPHRARPCSGCRDRLHALRLALRHRSALPEETCSGCGTDWRGLYGRIPQGPPGFALLPARRPLLRFGLADVLEIPLRELPEDSVLVRGFSIARLVCRHEEDGPLALEALRRAFQNEAPHALMDWGKRLRILERWVWIEENFPAVQSFSACHWCRGDLYDSLSSNVMLTPAEAARLQADRPELFEFSAAKPQVERLMTLPSE